MNDQSVTRQIPASNKTMISQPTGEATVIGIPIQCPVCAVENSPMETYCAECGFLLASKPGEVNEPAEIAEQPRLVATGGQEHYLLDGENSVGRENSDVLIQDHTVSRKHARIVIEAGKVWIEDLGSTNGTYVAGRQVTSGERVEVEDGSQIKLGSAILTLNLPVLASPEIKTPENPAEDAMPDQTVAPAASEQTQAEAAEPTSEEQSQADTAQPAPEEEATEEPGTEPETAAPVTTEEDEEEETPIGQLVYADDPSRSLPILEGTNTIGRRQTNSVVIDDQYVSGAHAQIVVDQLGIWLIDLSSTNGTILGGNRIQPNSRMALGGDDEIVFGRTNFHFRLVTKPAAEDPSAE